MRVRAAGGVRKGARKKNEKMGVRREGANVRGHPMGEDVQNDKMR